MKRIFLYTILAIFTFTIGVFASEVFASFIQSKEEPIKQEAFVENQNPFADTKSAEENSIPIDFDNLRINGIGLDSTEKDLIHKFGKPKKLHHKGFNNCGGGEDKTFSYNGLTVGLLFDLESKTWEILEIEVSSPKFQLDSGIKIGDSMESVKLRFRKNYYQTVEVTGTRHQTLVYGNGDGWANFVFSNGKLRAIIWEYNLC